MNAPALYAPDQPTREQWDVLAAQESLSTLIQKYGATRVQLWLRNLAAIHGQECD